MTTTRSVIVGVDGSASSEAACALACAEAQSRDLPLTVLHAWQPFPVFASGVWSPMTMLPDLTELEQVAQTVLARAGELVARTAPGLTVEQRLVQAPAASVASGAPLCTTGGGVTVTGIEAEDDSELVRLEAAKALANVPDPEAVPSGCSRLSL